MWQYISIDPNSDFAPQFGSVSYDGRETSVSDSPTYEVAVAKFAEVLISPSDIEEWLTRRYPDRDWTVKLVYYPLLLGHVFRGWRRFRILYDIRTESLVRSLVPFRHTDLRRLWDLGEQLEAFVSLLDRGTRGFRREKNELAASLAPSNTQISGLVERGLVGMGRHGPFVLKEIASAPVFRGSITLMELPKVPSLQITGVDLPIDRLEAELRLSLSLLWRMTLGDRSWVRLPHYQARSGQNDALTCVACVPGRQLWGGLVRRKF